MAVLAAPSVNMLFYRLSAILQTSPAMQRDSRSYGKHSCELPSFGITSMQDMSSAMSPDRAVALLEKAPTPIRVRVIRMAMTTPQGRDIAEGQSLLKNSPIAFH